MKTLLLSLILFLTVHFTKAQQLYFNNPGNIPLSDMAGQPLQNPWVGGINFPLWSSIDMNGDGLMDLYMYDQTNDRVSTFINDGTQSMHAYHYDPQYIRKFPKVLSDAWALCYDYNCDGKQDFFALDSTHNGIEVWRNDYTIQDGLRFTKVSSELEEDWSGPQPINIYATTIYVPAFADIDNDGDMDIISFNNPVDGKFTYHRNLSKDLYGNCDSLQFIFDDKCWGNFGLALGSNSVSTYHNTPCGTPAPPDPNGHSPEIAKRDDTITTVCIFDNDGDGVKELLIGDQASPTSLMVHNGGTAQTAEMDNSDATFPSYDTPVSIFDFVHHSYIDIDNDGKRDLLASAGQYEDKNGVWFYKNTNTDASPVFSLQSTNFLQNEMLETGQGACPVFFDYNADGLLDIIVPHGVYDVTGTVSRMNVYENTGTANAPAFKLVNEDYASLSAINIFYPITATFGDLDGDNDQDMIIGDFAGNIHYFNNSAGAGNPASFQLAVPAYMGIDVGNSATPQLVDLDNDGLLDLVIGRQLATLNYYHNSGTASSASFNPVPTIDTLGRIQLAQIGTFNGFSVPYIFTFNGRHQMLTANMHGDIYYYDNIDNNLNGTWNRIDTVASGEFGIRSTGNNIYVSGGDINNDGYMDLLVGLFSGGIQIFYGSNAPLAVEEEKMPLDFHCYPNPTGNQLTISGLKMSNQTISIYDLPGNLVLTKNTDLKGNLNTFTIDVSTLPSGMYILLVTNGKSIQHKKIVIQH